MLMLLTSQRQLGAGRAPFDGPGDFPPTVRQMSWAQRQASQGKYDARFKGAFAEKLSATSKNMPDDARGKCVGADARRSRVIFTILLLARARCAATSRHASNWCALTNLQYLNSIADLLKEFTGKDAAWSEDGVCEPPNYNSKGFRRRQESDRARGPERSISILARALPDEKLNGTNGFRYDGAGP